MKQTLFKPEKPALVTGDWWVRPPGPTSVHLGRYTPVLKLGKKDESVPVFCEPLTKTTI